MGMNIHASRPRVAVGEGAEAVSVGRKGGVDATGSEEEEAGGKVGAAVRAGAGEITAGEQAINPVKRKINKTVKGFMGVSYGQLG